MESWIMAAESSGSSGFLGVIVGALVVAALVIGFFAYRGDIGANHHTLDVNIQAPSVPGGSHG
jgi:hypothetical protein